MKFTLPPLQKKSTLKHLALLGCMLLINNTLPQKEPLAFGLFFAALSCGFHPLLCGVEYVLSSVLSLSWMATLSAAVQACLILLIFLVYHKRGKRPHSEKLAYAVIAQLPFVLLYPHTGYGFIPLDPIWQKAILALVIVLFSMLTDGGMHALIYRAFRCRLPAHSLAELCLMWTIIGMGGVRLLGAYPYFLITLIVLFAAVLLLQNTAAVPFALVLALPLCICEQSITPLSLYAVFACLPLLFVPYGKAVSALVLFLSVLLTQCFYGLLSLPAWQIAVQLAVYGLPLIVLCLLPQSLYRRGRNSLLFYRERTLPRVAINRNRRAVGEQLYEVSSLFREIGQTFLLKEAEENPLPRLRERLITSLCSGCKNKPQCTQKGIPEQMEKLIAVGCSKGKVSLVDLPEKITANCSNSAGLLFALNQHLHEYRRFLYERETARAGRTLLGEQALGISEILKNIALEQSEEFCFSQEESLVARALAQAGILSSEIFLYGEGNELTVSMTVAEKTNGKRLCAVVSDALNLPLALADKIPLTAHEACFVLRKKATYDASFGIASRRKHDSFACGDTHSILKIDEKRFIVALSDGMGSGQAARAVSDKTLTLLESFYKAKMPSELILSTVNKLLSYTVDETFSCLDLASVDLDSGIADVVKIGSPVGFVLADDKLSVLEGQSLPMGALEHITPVTMRTQLSENNFLLFMSDGITDAFGSSTELISYLGTLRPLNPQSLAEDILSTALTRYQGRAEDDMTVLAVKITAA